MAYKDDMNLLMVSLTMYFAPKQFLLHFKPKAAHSTTVNSLPSHVLTSTQSVAALHQDALAQALALSCLSLRIALLW